MQTPKDEYTSCDHPTAHTNNIQAKPRRESFAALIVTTTLTIIMPRAELLRHTVVVLSVILSDTHISSLAEN